MLKVIIFIISYVFIINSYGKDLEQSSYKATVTLKKYQSDIILADFRYSVSLHEDTGFVYLPIPFKITSDYIIEPNGNNNLILLGNIGPTDFFGICQLQLLKQESNVILTFNNIELEFKNCSSEKPLRAICFYFNEAQKALRRILPTVNIAKLVEVEYICKEIKSSDPISKYDDNNISWKIVLGDWPITRDITLYVEEKPNQLYLIIILATMALLIGLFAAPKVVKTKFSAWILFILSVVAICGIAILLFFVINLEILMDDTEYIVTIGSFSGLFIGVAYVSLIFLLKTNNNQ